MLKYMSPIAFIAAALAAPVADVPVLVASIDAAETTSTGPNQTQFTINSIAYAGTGCVQGSVGSFISDNRST